MINTGIKEIKMSNDNQNGCFTNGHCPTPLAAAFAESNLVLLSKDNKRFPIFLVE
jgi:hypothetical protein